MTDPSRLRVAIVGSGTVGRSVALNLKDAGVQHMTVFHRGSDRGKELAQALNADEAHIQELPARLHHADVIITATSSGDVIITAEMAKQALISRSDQPLLLLDLAMPRNIEPSVGEINGATLLHIDDLEDLVQETLTDRSHWIPAAEAIVRAGVRDFAAWMQHRRMGPMMQDLQHTFESLKQQSLDSLSEMDPDDFGKVSRVMDALVGRVVGSLAKYVRESHHQRLDSELGLPGSGPIPQIEPPRSLRALREAR